MACLDILKPSHYRCGMKMSTCKTCGEIKSVSAFYRSSLSRCKECTKKAATEYRWNNIEYVREFDRQRGLTPERKAVVKAQYRKRTSTKAGRAREIALKREWVERNRHKRNVHIVVGNAIKRGLIVPERCFRCGAEKAQAHHEDYSKPFEITWLCEPCHGARHRELNEKRRC